MDVLYSPMANRNNLIVNLFVPLYNEEGDGWEPDTLYPREAKTSFAFIAGKINEQTGFSFARSDTVSRSYLFWFGSDSLPNYTLMSAWADSGITDTVRIPVPQETQSATFYDYLGNPTGLGFTDSVELALTWQPVMVEFYHTAGISDGKPGLAFTVIPAPNPGRDGVRVVLNLSAASLVVLRLYNPTGRLVLVRETGQLSPGEHRVFLPVKRDVYFLKTEAGDKTRVIKAIVE